MSWWKEFFWYAWLVLFSEGKSETIKPAKIIHFTQHSPSCKCCYTWATYYQFNKWSVNFDIETWTIDIVYLLQNFKSSPVIPVVVAIKKPKNSTILCQKYSKFLREHWKIGVHCKRSGGFDSHFVKMNSNVEAFFWSCQPEKFRGFTEKVFLGAPLVEYLISGGMLLKKSSWRRLITTRISTIFLWDVF